MHVQSRGETHTARRYSRLRLFAHKLLYNTPFNLGGGILVREIINGKEKGPGVNVSSTRWNAGEILDLHWPN